MDVPYRLIVGITGASGAVLGVRLLEHLQERRDVETHLIVSAAGALTLSEETDLKLQDVQALADVTYNRTNIGAAIASGSFRADSMLVVPCSIKTLSGIAHAYEDNLIVRAASVTLKERRPLILVVRETPLHLGHVELMKQATLMGAVVMPPVPSFYARPTTMDEMVDQAVGRILDQVGIRNELAYRWEGLHNSPARGKALPER